MKIELHEILIRDLIDGYIDNAENGVVAYHGRLNVDDDIVNQDAELA